VLFVAIAACSSGTTAPHAASPSSPNSSSAPTTASSTSPSSVVATLDPNAPEPNAAGDIPDNIAYVPFTFAAGPFSLTIPEGWARVDASGATTFSDNFNSAQLLAGSAASAPTEQSARDNEVPAIQASSSNFHLDSITTVTRKGGTAVLIKYTTDSAANAVTGAVRPLAVERYEFWQNGKEGIVVLSGPVGADNVDPWRTISDSFVWS
jgi:hypothetical protein